MLKQKTRKRKGGAATPNAPKKQKRQTNYNLRPNSAVRQLINTFEPIKPLAIQEGTYNEQQVNNYKQQPVYNLQQQRSKVRRSRKNTVTQRAILPQKQQALITTPEHKSQSQPPPQMIISKPKKLEYLTPNLHRFNTWSEKNFEEVN